MSKSSPVSRKMSRIFNIIFIVCLFSGSGLANEKRDRVLPDNSALLLCIQETHHNAENAITFTAFKYQNNSWSSNGNNLISQGIIEEFSEDLNQKVKFNSISELKKRSELKLRSENNTKNDNSEHLLKSTHYPGWMGDKLVKISFSSNNVKETTQWNKRPLDDNILKLVETGFKKRYPKISYQWTARDLKVLECYFNAKNNSWLIGLEMNSQKNNHDGVPDPEFNSNWFYIEKGVIKFVGVNLYPLVAFTDMNNKPVWLMGYAGYNLEGYVLWNENFSKNDYFLYSFH